MSLLVVRSQKLSWIQDLNCHNCSQCLKYHKTLGLSFSLYRQKLSKLSKFIKKCQNCQQQKKREGSQLSKLVKIEKSQLFNFFFNCRNSQKLSQYSNFSKVIIFSNCQRIENLSKIIEKFNFSLVHCIVSDSKETSGSFSVSTQRSTSSKEARVAKYKKAIWSLYGQTTVLLKQQNWLSDY